MGGFSAWHLLIVLAAVVVIFGAGRLPAALGDVARGIRGFRAGMKDEAAIPPAPRGEG